MKKRILFVAAISIIMAACNQKPKTETFTINVDIANTEGQTIYLQKDGQVLDSAKLENWKASFVTPVCADNEMYEDKKIICKHIASGLVSYAGV